MRHYLSVVLVQFHLTADFSCCHVLPPGLAVSSALICAIDSALFDLSFPDLSLSGSRGRVCLGKES